MHRDDSVRFGGAAVGGIRVIAVSHIDAPITLSLALSRGKKSPHRIAVLQPADQEPSAPTADLDAVLKENDLTRDNLNQWLAEQGKPTLDTKPESAPAIAVWLAAKPANVAAVKGVTG